MAAKRNRRAYKSWRGFFPGKTGSKIARKCEALTGEYKNLRKGGYNVEGRDKANCLE